MPKLGLAKINSFDIDTHGFFFWNFRTELESKWDYQRAVAQGWLPTATERDSVSYSAKLDEICTAAPTTDAGSSGFSLLWHVMLIAGVFFAAWKLFSYCMSAERRGYSAITGTSTEPVV